MKEIQGKIKFVVINTDSDKNIILLKDQHKASNWYFNLSWFYLSNLTEEQAAEFVRMMTFESDIIGNDQDCYENYLEDDCWYDTAKESLISLLKANDIWIKDWCYYKGFDRKTTSENMCTEDQIEFVNKCPNDLLLIKLQ